MAAVRDFPRAQCMRTWLSSGSEESGIAERGAETPGGDDVTWFRSGTPVDGLLSLKDCVGRRPEYAAKNRKQNVK